MKYLIFLLAFAVIAPGWVDEDGSDSSIPQGTLPSGGDAITLTILNTFQVSSASQMLGLDTQDGSDQLVVMDNNDNLIRGVDMGTGNPLWTIPTPYTYTFGCCHNWPSPYGWYVNCYIADTNMYYYLTSWNVAFPNPAGTSGRGMDFQNDGNYIWETYSSGTTHGIYRIDETGIFTYYTVSEIPDQMSGLTVFPYNGNLGIFLTCYNVQDWFLYEFDGSSMTYIGSGDPGLSNFSRSYGLAYHPDTDTFFWSYKVYDTIRWIAEIEFTESALEQSTWGSLKTQF
ncbi:MAG: hypothetical protein KAW14_08785 [Candidatus Aegiribacteria sp.]|nr:hypothetical protein [Candidatus Aegiribacteria sp.]